MGWIHVDVVDQSVSSEWWRELIRHFANVGDEMEIRCWKEETIEISRATMYGAPSEDGYEVSVKGTVTPHMLAELLAEEPTDKDIYNKMTKYFTINIYHKSRIFRSEHYGTEIYLSGADDDISFISKVLEPYGDFFSVGIGE